MTYWGPVGGAAAAETAMSTIFARSVPGKRNIPWEGPLSCWAMLQHTGKQRLVVALVAFVTSAVATVVAAASSPSSSASAPHAAATAPAAGAETGGQATSHGLRIGLSYGDTLTWKSDKDLATGLNDAVELGASWVRVDLSWNDIQPDSPNTYEWSRFDRVARA